MRNYVAQKQYQAHVRSQTMAERINDASGNWTTSRSITDKAFDFSISGALGFKHKTTPFWKHKKSRTRMLSMAERGVARGKAGKKCLCSGPVDGGTINGQSVVFFPQTGKIFVENGTQFCADCCGGK